MDFLKKTRRFLSRSYYKIRQKRYNNMASQERAKAASCLTGYFRRRHLMKADDYERIANTYGIKARFAMPEKEELKGQPTTLPWLNEEEESKAVDLFNEVDEYDNKLMKLEEKREDILKKRSEKLRKMTNYCEKGGIKICKYCGAELSPNAKYCTYCGTNVRE